MRPRPKKPKKRALYSRDALARAVTLVNNRTLTISEASRTFGIPFTSLGDVVRGRTPLIPKDKTALTEEVESKLAKWIMVLSERGFRTGKQDIKDLIKASLDSRQATSVFKDNRPGRSWMTGFISRHKDVSERMTPAQGKHRGMQSSVLLQKWFKEYEDYVKETDSTLLTSPDRLFHVGESGFPVCPSTKKIMSKVVNGIAISTRPHITVMACSSAAGQYLPPMLIFPYQRDPRFNPLDGFEKASFHRTKNGWVSADVLWTWLRDVFVPAVEHLPKPVVLFVDGRTSAVTTIEICELCQKMGILLYCLRPHSSFTLQPLDQSYFDALKKGWSEAVREYILEMGDVVTIKCFAKVFKNAWQQASKPEVSITDFDRAGLFPFKPSVPFSSTKLPTSESSHFPSQPHLPIQFSPKDIPQTPEHFENCLNIMEQILNFGTEEGLLHLSRLREGNNVPDVDFQHWTGLYRKLIGFPLTDRRRQEVHVPVSDPSSTFPSLCEPSTSASVPGPCPSPLTRPSPNQSSSETLRNIPSVRANRPQKESYLPMTTSSSETSTDMSRRKKSKKEAKEGAKNEKEGKKSKEEKLKMSREERRQERKLMKKLEKEKEKQSSRGKVSNKKQTVETCYDVSEKSDDVVMRLHFDDDDDNDDDEDADDDDDEHCKGCHGECHLIEWVQCSVCDGWWHVQCVKDARLREKDLNDLKDIDFICETCAPNGRTTK